MSAPSLPRCCPHHRLAALELVDHLVAEDTAATVARMVAAGWPRDAAVSSVDEDYRAWLRGRLDDAVDFGLGWAAVSAEADR